MLTKAAAGLALSLAVIAAPADAQHGGHQPGQAGTHMARPVADSSTSATAQPSATDAVSGAHRSMPMKAHDMWMASLGRGWHLMGMAQVFPTMTTGSLWNEDRLLNGSGLYATQPAAMLNLASPGSRLVLRTTLNFEAWTQPDGELTYGGWGEGFIDSRHPHTLLHEAMLTANWWDAAGGALSISAGKGFAPYGTDDPMARPAVKFPTNHHLSQVLERWTVNAAFLRDGWGIEAGLFGGSEPTGPYDFSNIESFGDSWSARLTKRLGSDRSQDTFGPFAPWELSGSYARISEDHHGRGDVTELYNAAVRHTKPYAFGQLYGLAEASRSEPTSGEGHYSVLVEAQLGTGREARHQPYARVEYATRPEYERLGAPGTPEFFRYDHDAHEIGATRWLITTVGYGYESGRLPTSVRPFVELQHNRVRHERGVADPLALFGDRRFWSLSAGARVFFGGGPMRMGSYGVLDPMTAGTRPRHAVVPATPGHHGH